MKVLLDTHAWLWSRHAPERLNDAARRIFEDPEAELWLSAASSWEIAIKVAVGKLRLPEPPLEFVSSRIAEQALTPLPIQHVHAVAVAALPPHHRDPFDRMLVAQSRIEGIPLLTADPAFAPYDVELVWAGQGRSPRAAGLTKRGSVRPHSRSRPPR